MAEGDGTFKPIGDSDDRMHGEPAVLVSGFDVEDQQTFRAMLDSVGLGDVAVIYITASLLEHSLFELARMPGETGAGQAAKLPRAVVMSGLSENQLHSLMQQYRESGLPRPHWATVTPTSEQWSIKRLLIELLKEGEALRQAREAGGENSATGE